MMTTETKIIDLDEGLEFIEKFIKKLLRKVEGDPDVNITIQDKILVYTKIYVMSSQRPPHNYSKELYDKYKESILEYITSTVLPSLREKRDVGILTELIERWGVHKKLVKRLSGYFHYLDRYYVPTKSLQPLKESGLACFRDLVYDEFKGVYEEFKGKAMDLMISLISQQPEEKPVDRAVQKKVLDAFVELEKIGGTAINDFEEAVLKETATYYSNMAPSLMIRECSSYREYMLKAEECLAQEKNKTCRYLRASSQAAFREVVRHEFSSAYFKHNFEKEKTRFLALLRDGKMKELSRMFEPFSKEMIWSGPFANIFKQHIYTEAITIHDAARDRHGQEFFRKVIELHEKCLTYVNECFQKQGPFRQAMVDVFKRLCNTAVGARLNTELLASFFDEILKAGSSNQTSIEEMLEKAAKLLPYITAKDQFMELSREKLATRLLSGRANNCCERKFLTKLALQLGEWFQSLMDKMVEDITSTKKNQASFRAYIASKASRRPETDLAVMVLTPGIWKNFKSTDVNLPPEMAKSVEVYEGYYYGLKSSRSRKLIWIHSAGTCNVIGRFEPKTMELIVTPVQAAALLLFNSADRLSYSWIKTRLNMTDDDVIGILRSLSCANPKHKILNKVPASGIISQTDYFEFNSKFTNKMTRIKIPPPVVRESKNAINEVDKDRTYAIDSWIFRVMKRRKVLAHRKLVGECAVQLGLAFEVINERIEALMKQDFLKMDSVDPNLLRFIPDNMIPPPVVRESKKAINEVDKDRRYEIDAWIVRVMKRRKVLAHKKLVGECKEQLGLAVFKVIKERIEALMMRDFLERDSVDPNLLRYVP